MEDSIDILIETLEASIKKNGVKPLTNEWLLNILKVVQTKLSHDGPSEGDGPEW